MLHACDDCTCRFAPDATRCPQCGSTSRHEVGPDDEREATVAKLSRTGGLTDAAAVHADEAPVDDVADPAETETEPEPVAEQAEEQPDGDTADGETSPEVGASDGDRGEEAGPAALERPAGNASTATWADYVTALGGTPDADASRTDLIAMADELEAAAAGGN